MVGWWEDRSLFLVLLKLIELKLVLLLQRNIEAWRRSLAGKGGGLDLVTFRKKKNFPYTNT